MRYITVSQIKEGMVLGKSLVNQTSNTMIVEGTVLDAMHIERINALGCGGIYIEDSLSFGIKYHDVVSPAIRANTIQATRDLVTQIEKGTLRQGVRITKLQQERIVRPLMEEIIACPNRIYDMIDQKPYESYLYHHTSNVMVLSLLLGIELGLTGIQLYDLGVASMIYDVGNIFVPNYFLEKPGKLTQAEYEVIRRHTSTGFGYLREHFDISIEACMGALHHHENYDGSGYPNGLRKDKISIYGRVIAVTDVFDALTSRRPYRQAMLPSTAIDFLVMNSGTMFDPAVVEAMKKVVACYPSGFCVELMSGVKCIVTDNFHGYGDRPRLRMLGGFSQTPLYADLARDRIFADVKISHALV